MALQKQVPKGKITARVAAAAAAASDEAPSDSEQSAGSDGDEGSRQSAPGSEAESDYEELARARKRELKAKQSKKAKIAETDEFAEALTSILGQSVNTAGAPIMAKDRTRELQIKEEKLNYHARKALAEEKRATLSKDRVIPTMQNFDRERRLRKTATRGVIKLFNVVRSQQSELSEIDAVKNLQAEKMAQMSKSKFLGILKAKTS